MPVIEHTEFIKAPITRCFDLARDVDIHLLTSAKTKEKAVGGVTSGLLEAGDTVTWEAVHFGIKQRLSATIVEMEKPYRFTDKMLKGAFQSFNHTHEFTEKDDGTLMYDRFEYKSPLGPIGVLADQLFLENYMRTFIVDRAKELKRIAENR